MYGPNMNDKVLSYLRGAKDLRVFSLEQGAGVPTKGWRTSRDLPNLTEIGMFGAGGMIDAGIEKLAD